jgi:hypothetical protein
MSNPATPAEAVLAWDEATTFERNSAFIGTFGPSLGLTDAQIDALFIAANSVV